MSISAYPPPVRKTVEEEIDWIKEQYNLKNSLILETVLIALKQRVKRITEPEGKEYWNQVINELKNLK